jgi:glycosyltransferase involved in cell wall biosynthesis
MRLLIASPIPSHPQDQGNSARIFALGRLLQSAGAQVHFLYYPLEGLSDPQRAAMQRDWDALHVVPVERVNLAPGPLGYHGLDDWYDGRVTAAAAALHARHRYGAVIANYVWFSGVLQAFGSDVVRILDTHDVFGCRDARFREAGLAPEWFWTTPAEEARGLARADIVLAIQPEEAKIFQGLGHPDVRVLGHLSPWRARPVRQTQAPTVGYLASRNPINLDSFRALQSALEWQGGLAGARLIVAGALCDRLDGDAAPFEAIGRIGQVDEFYDRVDVVLNPMTFGTGLKIKSVEAIFEGLPLVATRAAMIGLPDRHKLHRLPDAAAVAACLPGLLADQAARNALAAASVASAQEYGAGVRAAARGLWQAISHTHE